MGSGRTILLVRQECPAFLFAFAKRVPLGMFNHIS